jgi:hypothetical protein
MTDAEQIAAFLAAKGATKCPAGNAEAVPLKLLRLREVQQEAQKRIKPVVDDGYGARVAMFRRYARAGISASQVQDA